MSSDSASEVKPPFGPPDCPWRKVSADSPIPEKAVYKDGRLEEDEVYIGRVYDGKNLLIGTAIPNKGVCIYLNKDSEVKESSDYEILTVDCGDPLTFEDADLSSKKIFVGGKDESGERLYVGRYVDSNGSTYYGWINKTNQTLHIPRDSSLGPQVLDKDFEVLIHKFLDRLCICPSMPPR